MPNLDGGDVLASSDNYCSGAREMISFTPKYAGTDLLILDTFQAAGCEVIVNIGSPVDNDDMGWGALKNSYR